MGIPKYHKWLTQRYPDAFAEASEESADHVYVDINTLLHDCMRHASSEEGFYQHLFRKLDALFRIVVPWKSVFLAVDGPASCAKCLTQRQRRRAHAQKDARSSKGTGRGKGGRGKRGKWDGGRGMSWEQLSNNMLTPGVPFMTKLTSALEYYAASRMASNGCFASCEAVTVSGAQAIGEGEHKIVSQMLRNAGTAAQESHVISSGDADIFLLSLVQSACRQVRVVSDRQDSSAQGKEGKGKRRRGTLQIWNAEVLARYIHAELSRPGAPRASPDEATLRRDFALVSLLAGNDYLPELKCSLNPQQLWEQYLALRRKKFPSTSLLQSSVSEEGLPLSHQEGGWALATGETGAAFAVEPYEHFSFNLSFLSKFMTVAAGGSVAPSKLDGRASEGVRRYLEGLLWILEMYHHGYCGDFYFVLEKSLHSFASARLITQFLPSLQPETEAPLAPPRSECQPMRPISCAICILPVQNAEQYLCPAAPMLEPMFGVEHPLLGSVNAIERCEALKDCKQKTASLQQEMMSLRAQGLDDRSVKAKLTAAQQEMEKIKQGGSDIDVVPLWEVDAEVAERCASELLPELEFRPDVTLLRDAAGEPEPFTLEAPVRGMRPAHCEGLLYVTGEWPQVATETDEPPEPEEILIDDEAEEAEEAEEAAGAEAEEAEEAECDVGEELWDEALAEGEFEATEDAVSFQVGDSVQAYWPEDEEYLPATIIGAHNDGSFQIAWDADGSESHVQADYLQHVADSLEPEEPKAKRARYSAP